MTSRQLYLHIGAPKTGTTYLQSVFRANRQALAAHRFCYPGSGTDHFLAVLDLMGRTFQGYDDPRIPGSWQRLADEVTAFDGNALISHEILSGARSDRIERAVSAFPGHQVHVVFTARDLARQLPAVWQERVKNRAVMTFTEFFEAVSAESTRRAQTRLWRMQDIARVLGGWAEQVPADRIHLVTVPPRGAPRGLLLERFLGLLGIAAEDVDTTMARGNESLGAAETNLIRRLNAQLAAGDAELPWPVYSSEVKFFLANEVLPGRTDRRPILLTEQQHAWTVQETERQLAHVSAAGYDVVGDLSELVPAPFDRTVPYVSPDAGDPALERDAAVDALAGLLVRVGEEHRRRAGDGAPGYPGPVGPWGRVRRRLARIGWVRRLYGRLRG